jgi:hypothetical protein
VSKPKGLPSDDQVWADYQAYLATFRQELETVRPRAASEAQARSWATAAAERALRKAAKERRE